MKKTKRGKGKNPISNKKKKFFQKQLPVIAVVAAFILCAVLLAGISKPTGHAINQGQNVWLPFEEGGYIYNLFSNWEGGNFDTNVAKYLFWFMLTGIIWGALSAANFPRNSIFQAMIAIPSGFLATAYITPQDVFAVLQSWNALGIALTFVLPFMIAVLVSSMFYSAGGEKTMTLGKVLVGLLLWVTLAIVYVYKTLEGWVLGQISFLSINLPMVLSFGITLVTVLIVIGNHKFRMWMWQLGLEVRAMTGQLTSQQVDDARNAMIQVARMHAAARVAKAIHSHK